MFYDSDGIVITSTAFAIESGDDFEFVATIDCFNNFQIKGYSPDPEIDIFGKVDAGDSYQNISTSPIDVTAYAGEARPFYFRVIVGDVDQGTIAVRIHVEPV